mgnify:CR=1 FL=1
MTDGETEEEGGAPENDSNITTTSVFSSLGFVGSNRYGIGLVVRDLDSGGGGGG